MTRSMRRRFRKILLASTLALLGATGAVGAQERAPKTRPDPKTAYKAMMKPYEDQTARDTAAQILAHEIEIREAKIRTLEHSLQETISQMAMERQEAKYEATRNEHKVQENARRLAKIEQYNQDREARDAKARVTEDARQARQKAEYEQHNKDIIARNAAQQAAHYAHRPIYGPLIAAPGIPEFTSLKGMVDRLKYYEQEIRLASGNGYRVQDLAQQMNTKLNSCVGHEVTWEFKVLRVHPEGETSYGVTASGIITVQPNIGPNDYVYGLGLDLRKNVGPGMNQECLEVGLNVSQEVARSLTVDDVILVRGTIAICRMDVDGVVQMNLNKAQMNAPMMVQGVEIVIDARSARVVGKANH